MATFTNAFLQLNGLASSVGAAWKQHQFRARQGEQDSDAKVLLNFLPIQTGGGQQNALSFLETIAASDTYRARSIALVRRGSRLLELAQDQGMQTQIVGASSAHRLAFEARCRTLFKRGQVCFTLFGPTLLGAAGYLISVNGCAYSNLFYPEIDFWGHLDHASRMKTEAIDVYRRLGIASADYWIFETDAIRQRAVDICRFPVERTAVVRMATSALVSPERVQPELRRKFDAQLQPRFRILFLSGAHPNKRLHLLPAIARALRQRTPEFCFVTTFNPTERYAALVQKRAEALGVSGHFVNLGPIPPAAVASLIDCADALACFSRLESFTNNFVEAWRMRRPMIATDSDWARSSCGEGALYVDPEQPEACAAQLTELISRPALRDAFVSGGDQQLKMYPSAAEKTRQYFEHIDAAGALGHCPPRDHRRIRWPLAGHASTALKATIIGRAAATRAPLRVATSLEDDLPPP